MNCIKKHIATLLLLGFLFPQLANAVHFHIVAHKVSAEKHNKDFFSGPSYEYHFCDYHFSAYKFLLPSLDFSGKDFDPECGPDKVHHAFLHFTEKVAFHYSARGPPNHTRTSLLKHNFLPIIYLKTF